MPAIQLGKYKIGPGHPCFIVAEAGVNHNGSLEMARQLVDVALEAEATAIKFQAYKAERLASKDAPKAEYQVRTTGGTESQLEMLRRLELSHDAHRDLMGYCRQRGILFMSTPFDEDNADFLDELGIPVFKIPSGEITNLRFLAHVARKGKPMIVSTGMSNLGEVDAAVRTIREEGNRDLVLLHCVSSYPAAPRDVNLKAMRTMALAFSLPVGYSDHTPGVEVALAAVALGACVVEKHITLNRNLPGPDHQASLEPDELKALVRGVRIVEEALGDGQKVPTASEKNTAAIARKSLVAARDLPAGTRLAEEHLTVKRPGNGLPPAMLGLVVGRTLKVGVGEGTLIALEMLG